MFTVSAGDLLVDSTSINDFAIRVFAPRDDDGNLPEGFSATVIVRDAANAGSCAGFHVCAFTRCSDIYMIA